MACQMLCQMNEFLSEVSSAELEFMAIYGRRWRPGDGVVLPDALIFDPAKPAESCKLFRRQLRGTPLPHRDAFLEKWIGSATKSTSNWREEFGQRERVPGFKGFIFVGKEIEGLKRCLRIRSMKFPLCQESDASFFWLDTEKHFDRSGGNPVRLARPSLFPVQS